MNEAPKAKSLHLGKQLEDDLGGPKRLIQKGVFFFPRKMTRRGFRTFASMVRRPVWTSTHWRCVLIVEG